MPLTILNHRKSNADLNSPVRLPSCQNASGVLATASHLELLYKPKVGMECTCILFLIIRFLVLVDNCCRLKRPSRKWVSVLVEVKGEKTIVVVVAGHVYQNFYCVSQAYIPSYTVQPNCLT